MPKGELQPGDPLPDAVWASNQVLTFRCPVEVLLPDVKEYTNNTIELRISATDVYGANYHLLYQRLRLYDNGDSDIDHGPGETQVTYPDHQE